MRQILFLLLACGCASEVFVPSDPPAGDGATADAGGGAPSDAGKMKPSSDGGVTGDSSAPSDAAKPPGKPTLEIVSGNGSTCAAGWPGGDSLRVRARDANGDPAVGETIAWSVTKGGSLHIQNASSSVTDADGIAAVTFNAFGFGSWLAYEDDTAEASWNGLTADFDVILLQVPAGNLPTPPLVDFSAPLGTQDLGAAKAGSTIPAAIAGVAVMQQGPGYGQGIPGWGLRITDVSDPLKDSPVQCAGGTVIADAKGNISCDVIVPSKPGEYSFSILAAGQLRFNSGHITAQ